MFSERFLTAVSRACPNTTSCFRKQTDRIEKPWYPDCAVNRGEYLLDRPTPSTAKVSQRIRQKSGDPATLGITQSGMYFKAGEPLRLALHLRAGDPQLTVKATLWGEGKVYASAEFKPATAGNGSRQRSFPRKRTPTPR